MNTKEELIMQLTPALKEKGYKKNRQTWNKAKDRLVIVFNIQNSQWDKADYYLNLGISINALSGNPKARFISSGDIWERIPAKNDRGIPTSAEQILSIIDMWENWYGDLPSLRKKAIEGRLPLSATARAVTYLTTVAFTSPDNL